MQSFEEFLFKMYGELHVHVQTFQQLLLVKKGNTFINNCLINMQTSYGHGDKQACKVSGKTL